MEGMGELRELLQLVDRVEDRELGDAIFAVGVAICCFGGCRWRSLTSLSAGRARPAMRAGRISRSRGERDPMKRLLRAVPLLLAVSLGLNLVVAAGIVAMAASGSVADRIAPRVGLASERQLERAATDAEETKRLLGEVAASGETVADSLDELDGSLADLESRVSGLEVDLESISDASLTDLGNLSADVRQLQADVGDVQSQADGACRWALSAESDWIGSDLFYTFSRYHTYAC